MEPTMKATGSKRLKVKYDQLLSNVAFNFNLRRYSVAGIIAKTCVAPLDRARTMIQVGRCRLTLSNPR
jgi:hypothetical protein